MNSAQLFTSFFLTTVCLGGCASLEYGQQSPRIAHQSVLIDSPDQHTDIRDYAVFTPQNNHKNLNDYVQQMIMDFRLSGSFRQHIAIASFVEFDGTLTKTNSLGNQLAETFLIEMSQAGYPVSDINASGGIISNADGSFAFTREQQNRTKHLCCALSGNLIYQSNGVRVNSKLFDINTKRIYAASSLVIPYFVVEHLGQTQTN